MKLASRILLAVLLPMGIVSYQFFDWITSELKPRYREAVEESLVDTAYLLAAQLSHSNIDISELAESMSALNRTRFTAKIYELKKEEVDLRVSVTDAAGRVLFDSFHPENVGTDASEWRNVKLTLQGQYGARTTRDDPENAGSTVLYVSAPIAVGGATKGVVTVGKPTKSANYFIDSAQTRLIQASAVLLLVALVLAAILSNIISRPLERLTAYARNVRDGRPAVLPSLGTGEVGRLGEAFEQMRISLEGKNYIEQYVQALTHEVKSPLAAIRGAAELLSETGMPEDQRRRFLSNIQTEAERIAGLVDQLLNLAAIEARPGQEGFCAVSAEALCAEVLDALRPRFEQKALRICRQFQPCRELQAEPQMLRQALSNLIENAIEFSPNGGSITVSVGPAAQHGVQIEVIDEGPGIPDYAKPRVCEKFFSLPRPDTGRKSSGLGLALVSEVTKRHNAIFQLSDRLPHGTRATITWAMS